MRLAMKHLYLFCIIMLFSCSHSYDEADLKKAETMAILLDMNLSESFSDVNKILGVWETMPEQVRDTKNPTRNPYDFKVEIGNCKKNLAELDSKIPESIKGEIPKELEEIIEKFRELYVLSCNAISSPDASYNKLREFRDKYEPEYKKLQESLTKVQKEYVSKK